MYVDTHLHIDLLAQLTDLTQISDSQIQHLKSIFDEAAHHRVTRCVTIGTNRDDSSFGCLVAAQFPKILYATIGVHPTECATRWQDTVAWMRTLLTTTGNALSPSCIVGIGECGIDLYRTATSLPVQRDFFRAQIELALEFNLPLVVHSRDAAEETLMCLDEFRDTALRGIIHCYSYSLSIAREYCTRNFKIGLGGTVTYPKNEELRLVAQQIALSDFVLETDAPFLPPQPWRGKPNHPKYIPFIADYISQLRAQPVELIAEHTTQSAEDIFKFNEIK